MPEAPSGAGPAEPRRILFIVGSGRSGTSALACTLQTLGMQVPQPEVAPDETNPKGFGESQWVVDFHDKLLQRANVRVADGRPAAWFDTGKLSTNEQVREQLVTWVDQQFSDGASELVIKDPRLSWFLGLWRSTTLRRGIDSAHAIMLRAPTEVVGSKQKYYSGKVSETSRTASWVNHMLHTERATRGSRRMFVGYHQLLDDWTLPIYGLGEHFGLQAVQRASAKDLRRVHELIDPDLHRVRTSWDELDVPKSLRAVTEETWHHLFRLIDPENDVPQTHAALDDLRLEYTRLYEEAEAIAQSSVLAAGNKAKRRKEEQPATAATAHAPTGSAPRAATSETFTPAAARMRALLGRRKGS